MVVVKRLADALKDGDHVYAIIKGIAINNDSASKRGYASPSIDGQARVIADAQNKPGVEILNASRIWKLMALLLRWEIPSRLPL